jgi:septal ring factor EnvC (AmiA/AmiB activator)
MLRALQNSLFALIALTAVAAHAARPTKEDAARRELQQAERARAAEQAAQQEAAARAAAAAAEARRLTEDRIAAAARLRQAEDATADLAARMDELAAKRRQAETDLAARAETMQPLLPLIERLSLFPAETLTGGAGADGGQLRGVLHLRGLAGSLARRPWRWARADQARVRDRRHGGRSAAAGPRHRRSSRRRPRHSTGRSPPPRRGASRPKARPRQPRSAPPRAARAETLHGMLVELDAQRRAEQARAREEALLAERQKRADAAAAARQRQADLARPAGPGTIASAAQPHGQLTAPVAGTIVRAWGDATDAGPATGISYRAPPAARVVAACSGRVAFAASFRSYGLLLIVDCGGGYHAVLAGFDRLDVKVGQTVSAGEPVGVMPGWEPGAAGSRPALYVELRRDGQPVNPAPWLRASG